MGTLSHSTNMVHEHHLDLISAIRDCLEESLFAMDSHPIV